MIVRGLQQPAAARMQEDVTATDHQITDLARLSRPAVRWWWGERKREGGRGAYCYLCDRMVVTWDTRFPITEQARRTITTHRDRVHVPGAIAGSTDAGRVPRHDPKEKESVS